MDRSMLWIIWSTPGAKSLTVDVETMDDDTDAADDMDVAIDAVDVERLAIEVVAVVMVGACGCREGG